MKTARFFASIAAVCAVMIGVGCRVQGSIPGEEQERQIQTEDESLKLSGLELRYSGQPGNLFNYNGTTGPYLVDCKADAQPGEQFLMTVTTSREDDIVEVYKNSSYIYPDTGTTYPLPILDLTGSTYLVNVTVTRILEPANEEEGIEEKTEKITYVIAINPPNDGQVVPFEEIKDTIQEAEEAIETLPMTMVVGNPSLNSEASQHIVDAVSALNVLKQGTSISRSYTKINPDGSVTTESESIILYNLAAITTCLSNLKTLIDNFSEADGIIRQPFMMFSYTGQMQSVPIDPEYPSVYELEAVGASGGHATNSSEAQSALGGSGGHVKARFSLTAGQALTLRVGGQGTGTAMYEDGDYILIKTNYRNRKPGGWPNGGSGGNGSGSGPNFVKNSSWAPGTGGGGSTDFALGSYADDTAFAAALDYTANNDPRLVVAAGGGGCVQRANNPWPLFSGANAGENGIRIKPNGQTEGTQPAAGSSDTQYGVNGRGGSTSGSSDGEGSGGGGGGFKGGGSTGAYQRFSTGAGGSNHIRTGNTGPSSTAVVDTYGDGWAKITWISN
ncbi:MAG: hypothetical protein LBD22_04735 [Spirochaetaceae bacterium]|nr:hypothetical protein [Spirochaetaceae bacterium]